MKHLAAYLLLGLAGNTSPSASDIKGVLESVGIDAEEDRLDKLLSELKGKDIQTVRADEVRCKYCTSLILAAVNPRRFI
jgi:large subunit ribosomal protein LP2